MNRIKIMQDYWNTAAKDPDVDIKYICDLPTEDCLLELGELSGKVLEIGCGVGRLMQKGNYGVDISERMLKIAKRNRPDCYFKLTTGDIPFENNYFNNVFSFLLFQHLKPKEISKYIEEAHRVLKPEGRLTFQFIPGDEREPFSNHYSFEEIGKWLDDAGFKTYIFSPSNVHHQWAWVECIK